MSFKIFIVEDDPAYAQVLTFRLKQSGFNNLTVFSNGEECLENLNKNPDMILLDFSLPGLNGLDTLNHIKKSSKRTKVVVLTGLENKKVARECLDAGALDYLQKDDDAFDKIVATLKTVSDKKKRATIMLATILIVISTLIIFYLII